MADEQAKKILTGRWADTGDRTDPDDATLSPVLSRTTGWPAEFSATDGDTPRRRVFNQRFRELDGVAFDVMRYGVLPYDADIDYPQNAVTNESGNLYRALVDNGPASANATDPTASGQTVWETIEGATTDPSAPSAPQATAPRSGELDWFWNCPLDGGAQVTEFDFQWRVAGNVNWSASLTPSTARQVLTGLTNGASIEARVRARTSFGTGPWSTTGTATVSGTVPGGGPTLSLRAEAGDTEVDLNWLEPDDGGLPITGYEVQSRQNGQNWPVAVTTVTTLSHTVTGLVNGTPYDFRNRAVNSQGNGEWSNVAMATPTAAELDQDVPDQADAPQSSAGNGQITWFWNAPSDNGSDITSYSFRYREQGTAAWTTVTVSVPARIVTSLTNGTTYEAQVRATNGVGTQSSYSPNGTATPQAEVPDQIQHVGLVNTSFGVQSNWGEPEENGSAILDYRIEWDDNSSFSSPQSATITATNRLITGISDGTTLYVRVRARNVRGNASWSPTAQIDRDDGQAVPDAPTSLDGSVRRPLMIDWAWPTPDDNGAQITSYELQWRVSGSAWSGNIVSTTPGCVTTSATNATNAIEARVRARNIEGVSAWSSTASVSAADLASVDAVPQSVEFTSSQVYAWPWQDVGRAVLRTESEEGTIRDSSKDISLGTGGWDGAVSDGTTIWFVNDVTGTALAYVASTRARDSSKDISLGTGDLEGAVSDGTTIWFVNNSTDTALAYVASTRARDSSKDISLATGGWEGAVSDGTTIWFVNNGTDTALAYVASTRARDSSKDISLATGGWEGAVSDGTTIWFVNNSTDTALAYVASTRARDSSKDISLGTGDWESAVFDGTTIWFVDSLSNTALAYFLSVASIVLRSVTVEGNDIGTVSGIVFGDGATITITDPNGTVTIYPQC